MLDFGSWQADELYSTVNSDAAIAPENHLSPPIPSAPSEETPLIFPPDDPAEIGLRSPQIFSPEPTVSPTDGGETLPDSAADPLTGSNSETGRQSSFYGYDSLLGIVDLGDLNGTQTVGDSVGYFDSGDIYRFTLATPADFRLVLEGLSADADVELSRDFNANGRVDYGEAIAGSYHWFNRPELIEANLEPGTYFVNVYPYQGTTAYNLTLSATPTSNHLHAGFNSRYGYGLVNASAAVAGAIASPAPLQEVPDRFGDNWGLDTIGAPEVWNAGYTGTGVVVAVIDSGVDYTHPDLANNIWHNSDEIPGNGIDDDANGFVDDAIGWDFVDGDRDPMDAIGHGTHIAGTIAAADDGFGITGVAPGAQIMPVRVLDSEGAAAPNEVATGIYYAVDNGADIINLSLGGNFPSPPEERAIEFAVERGVAVVMAAGNSYSSAPAYPAYYAKDNGIAVGAVDAGGNLVSFSNRAGEVPLDYVGAPGQAIYSTTPNNTYSWYDGTSMATPHVSGTVALMLSANPGLSVEQVENILIETANPDAVLG
ncbi:MAG: S8 family serine peptidase [Limnospira sp.]